MKVHICFKKARWHQDNEGVWISLLVDNRESIPRLKQFTLDIADKLYIATIKLFRKQRSKDANAYCWELIGKLAAKLRITPEEVYQTAVQEIGGNYEIIPVRNDKIEHWKRIWGAHGLGWVCNIIGPCKKVDGYTNVASYYGSSVYDTEQMSRLIDAVIFECKKQGIETRTPEELARLKEDWH